MCSWDNWWDGRGLLRVKIYEFAIYVDGEQVRAGSAAIAVAAAGSSRLPRLGEGW
jgi:hypothetical protein